MAPRCPGILGSGRKGRYMVKKACEVLAPLAGARNTQGGMLQNASNLPQRLDMYRMPISNVFLVVHFFLSVSMSISPSVQELTF